ncbi:MAG: SAM-dependent methyltransferase [Myxococcales bacterium]|nr:SAM-dependent methyltransferase [Myxococcales bacterium]
MKRTSEAAQRNREPIREVLARHLPAQGLVLEIASGTGEHAVHMAGHLTHLDWQPSDVDADALASIEAWRAESGRANLLPPIALDVTSMPWPVSAVDAVVCINMVHIAPWESVEGLFTGSARALAQDGLLYLYGPYKFHGRHTAPSNEDFDRSLRARDPSWGVRDIRELTVLGTRTGFGLEHTIAMPANNYSLIFRRRAVGPPTGAFKVF